MFIAGFAQFQLKDLAQHGWQILLSDLFLPARTPFSKSLAQLVLEWLRNGFKGLKRFGPFDHCYCCRRVCAGCALDSRQRHELSFSGLKSFQVELQQPWFIFADQNTVDDLAVFWIQTAFRAQALQGGNDELKSGRGVELMEAACDA